MEKAKHEVLSQNWAENIEQRINSGMTIKEWCQANNIMESQYYYWLKVVRREAVQQAGGHGHDGNAECICRNTGAVRGGIAIRGMPYCSYIPLARD